MSQLAVRRMAGRSVGFLLATWTLLAAGSATPAGGQQVDRGTFRIFVEGREVGTEEFTIRRRGTGDAQITFASGRVSMRDGRELETFLQVVGPELALVEYAAKETGTDTAEVKLARAGNRLRALTNDQWGRRMRSYRALPATVVLDTGVAHHYFVLREFAGGESIQQTMHAFARGAEGLEPIVILDATQENIVLGGEQMEATRINFSSGGGTGMVWFDGSRRLVRVTLPADGFVAERLP